MRKLFIIPLLAAATVTGCGHHHNSHHSNTVPSYAVSKYANIPGFQTPHHHKTILHHKKGKK